MALSAGTNDHWDWEVGSRSTWGSWSFQELWAYRHLLFRFIRRDFLLNYQQTILGPLWIVLQPVLTLVVYVLVFGKWIGVSTGTVPPVLFFLCGILLWGLCNDLFTGTAFIFTWYNYLYSKVYFPRLIIPFSITGTHLARFLIQLVLLLVVFVYYWFWRSQPVVLNVWLLFVPIAVLLVAAFSLSLGLLFSILTARYRDLSNIVHLGIRLFMFVTPVIYPLALVPQGIRWLVTINPLTALFEVFRYALLGQGSFTAGQLAYSSLSIILMLVLSLVWFNKQSARLIDVV
ncbi:MAG: ABC transporter permease [Niastella sp.]|nr:ABC transporter permease [Niastella sp.]